jgi:hypothetical protein
VPGWSECRRRDRCGARVRGELASGRRHSCAVEAEVQAEAEERQFVERRRALIEDLSSTIGILAVVASDLSEIVVNSEF